MKRCLHALEVVAVLAWTPVALGASGGRIFNSVLTNSQLRLWFTSTSGYTYQVQSCAVADSKYWCDTLASFSASGSVTNATVPAQAPVAFFRVLEFTNRAFWYDWAYYYEAPTLANWALGSSQSGYAHRDRAYGWYIDQGDTGTYANNNCGPSSVTMAIKWYDSSFSHTAADARNTYPEGGGWWYSSDIINYLNLYSVPNTTSSFTGTNQLVGLLNQSNVVILCIDTTYLTYDSTAAHRTGRFYSYQGGHFLVVKGWRATDSGLFFEAYDPNNWHATYADRTPKGRNRHYAASDLANAIAKWWNYLIVVHPPGSGGGDAAYSLWIKPVDVSRIPHAWGI